jgi:hypothetical protein
MVSITKPTFKKIIWCGKPTLEILTVGKPKNKMEALDWSIAKWEYIVKHWPISDDGGITTCGCCLYTIRGGCRGMCLIAEYTRAAGCCGTPYELWAVRLTLKHALKELAFLRKVKKHFMTECVR